MKITFLCQYFPPEMGAPSARTFEHARRWVSLGHEVTVITGFPNHPTGVIPPEYRGCWVRRERAEGVEVLRTWIYAAPNKGFARRILNFFSFLISSFVFGTALTARPDVVIGTSPQFFCAVAAYFLSVVKRVPFVFEVRDIWPQSAIELGMIRNPWLIKMLEAIEMFLYRRAALIVPVAHSTRDYLIGKGISADKIKIVPNGVDLRYLESAVGTPEEARRELGLQNQFLVSYIGTHGLSHALETLLYAAAWLREEKGIHFVFIGEGAQKAQLKETAVDLCLENVTFLDQLSRERLLGFYRASDVSIVPLKRLPIFAKVLPSKLFELMGTERPIICSVEGEAADLVRLAEAGLCIEPENVLALIAAIRRLREDSDLRYRLGVSGSAFVKAHFLRSRLAEDYLEALSAVLQCRTPLSGYQKKPELGTQSSGLSRR